MKKKRRLKKPSEWRPRHGVQVGKVFRDKTKYTRKKKHAKTEDNNKEE